MKRFFILLAAATVAAACAKESVEAPASSGLRTVTVGAVAEGIDSKVSYASDATFGWQADDIIGVYTWDGTTSKIIPATFAGTPGSKTGSFTMSLEEGQDYYNVAFYPYSPATTFAYSDIDGGDLTFDLPSDYTGVEDLEEARMPMAAWYEDDAKSELHFKNIGGLVKVTLKNVPAEAKYFKLTSDKGISGTFALKPKTVGDAATVLVAGSTASSTQISLAEGKDASELVLYFPVPTGDMSFGFEVYGDGMTILKQDVGSSVNTISRGTILRMPAITLPSLNYVLKGNFEGNDWTDIAFSEIPGNTEWKVAANLPVQNVGYASMKVYETVTDKWFGAAAAESAINLLVTLTSPGENISFTVHDGPINLDVYFNKSTMQMFALTAGSPFAVPAVAFDDYNRSDYGLIGSHGTDNWHVDYPAKAIAGTAWYAIRGITPNAAGVIEFKLRSWQDETWNNWNVFGSTETLSVGSVHTIERGAGNIVTETLDASKSYDVLYNAASGLISVIESGDSATEADVVATIWIGSTVCGDGWDSVNQDLAWGNFDWSVVSPCDLTVYFTCDATATECLIAISQGDGWGDISGWKYPAKTDTSWTFELTQDILDQLAANNGLIVRGRNITITRMTLK